MRVPALGRRRRVAACAAFAASAALLVHVLPLSAADEPAAAPRLSPAAGLDDSGYLAVADGLQRRLDALWSPRLGRYEPGPGAATTQVNADLLLVHSLAAQRDHHGPTRADDRARLLARFLVGPRIWAPTPPLGADPQITGPGWVTGPGRNGRHMVHDTAVVDGLVHAYLARDALGLDRSTVARIRDQIHRVATSRDWRWPAIRLNQLNWYCAMFAADAIVNGSHKALADGMAQHLARFLAGAAGNGAKAGNLGAGLRFHYLPERGLRTRSNVDSAEYANIVLSFSRFYGQARAAGMPAPVRLGLLRDWVRRAISGYWTHGGYLNWDTGLGFYRWHQRKKIGLAQLALIGVAAQPELQPGGPWGGWAKWLLDRGLTGYAELVEREGRIPAAIAFGVKEVPEGRSNAYLAATRTAANAYRALEAGLGRRPAQRPPALYSFDPDTGRLAVTTPAYNTAIVPVNQDAIPYGGLDLARLFDGRQEVAANIGGSGRAAFGLTARANGRALLATQYGDRAFSAGVTPLRLTHAPRGAGVTAATARRRAYAGPFTELRASGAVSGHGLRATTDYRFTPSFIDARWTLRGTRDVACAVTFPSWGRGARVHATLSDGSTVRLGRAPLAWARVRSLAITSERSGYRVTPLTGLAGGTVRLVKTVAQPADPNPGSSVEVSFANARHCSVAARITVR